MITKQIIKVLDLFITDGKTILNSIVILSDCIYFYGMCNS